MYVLLSLLSPPNQIKHFIQQQLSTVVKAEDIVVHIITTVARY